MYDVIILGAGGTGREIAEMFEEVFDVENYRLKGFLSDVLDVLDNYEVDYPLIGTIKDYEVQENDRFILAIGDIAGRRKVAESILNRGGKFINFIHPLAKVMKSAKIGQGVIIFPFAWVGADAELADFCFVNLHAACGHDVKLGAFCELAPYSAVAGGTSAGEECLFALHAVVAPKTVLGNNVVISQGSVTQKNQADNMVVIGVPGKSHKIISEIKI